VNSDRWYDDNHGHRVWPRGPEHVVVECGRGMRGERYPATRGNDIRVVFLDEVSWDTVAENPDISPTGTPE